MWERLEELEREFDKIERSLGDPEVLGDRARYEELTREHARLSEIVAPYREYLVKKRQLADAKTLVSDEIDSELRELAAAEVHELTESLTVLEERLKVLLAPRNPLDDKNVILEIRAGTGGEEAALFGADLFRMYSRFAERMGFKTEVLSLSDTDKGGIREVIAAVAGDRAYSLLKFESGVHRVQRVPATEASGRIHTSAATVAVLPEAEEVDIQIGHDELQIDTYCASGPGGQHVNKTESAVRVTHLPTGLVVTCQDEKSQLKNRDRALRVLRARLFDRAQAEQQKELAEIRRSQVGTGDRSERIRTYNFPQNRVTDHRIGLTSHRLQEILDGDIHEIVDELLANDRAQRLADS